MITKDLRLSLARAVAAAGLGPAVDPGLRPTGIPGRYAASVALALDGNPRETAETLARALAQEDWIATAAVTGPGYLAVTVTPEALVGVADRVIQAGPGCLTSDALAQRPVPAPPPGDPLTAPTWEKARATLAVQLTARLAAAAGAPPLTNTADAERSRLTLPATPSSPGGAAPSPVASAVAFAGSDAVTFTLARAIPGKQLRVDPLVIARRVLGNPAYAVRYAHARAASGLRWVASSPAAAAGAPCPPAGPRELALLDALSWLPERVVTAARRDRPDEFARYLEELASVTVEVLIDARHPGSVTSPGSDRLALAEAARTGLAAGLGLLGVSAPERL